MQNFNRSIEIAFCQGFSLRCQLHKNCHKNHVITFKIEELVMAYGITGYISNGFLKKKQEVVFLINLFHIIVGIVQI